MSDGSTSDIHVSRVDVARIGGLEMVAAAMAHTMPDVRRFTLVSVVGGRVGGGAFLSDRWRRGPLDWDKPASS